MPAKLTILACEYLQDELRCALELDDYPDVAAGIYPGYCVRFPHGETAQSPRALLDHLEQDHPTVVLGGGCLDGIESLPWIKEDAGCLRTDQCQKLVAGEALVEHLLAQGAYLLTPGWLRHWRRHIEEWGFDRETARDFFQECTRSLVLLDTGTDPDCRIRLEEFSTYLDLPGEALPVGLDHFRCLVRVRVMDWRLEGEKKAGLESIALANRRTADYEMSFDLISRLVEAESEERAIAMVFELFTMLLAPDAIIYLSTAGRKLEAWSRSGEITAGEADIQRLASLVEDYAWTEDGRGFRIRISHEEETLGVLELEEVAFQEYRDHYLNIALTLSRVCGLAIANARRREELQAVNRELEGYAHTVSHDLKGPLSGVVSGAQLLLGLLEDPERPDRAVHLEDVARIMLVSAGKSIDLVDDLLELAEAGQEPRHVVRVEVGEVLRGILEERAGLIEEKGLTVRMSEDMGTVWASPAHIYQLFSNLVGNAVKYSDNPEPRVEVERLQEEGAGRHRYLVRDNGSGIAPEDLERVFDPFFKGERGGTGIGLATVERIVKTYGGEIRAYNRDGACFEFTLRDLEPPGL
jgi:signal transduction histidine kinase